MKYINLIRNINYNKNITRLLVMCSMVLYMNCALADNHEKESIDEDKIIIIGASYAKGWLINRLSCLKVVNKGIDGNQSFEIEQRFYEDAIKPQPKAIVIWGFINDLHANSKENITQTVGDIKRRIVSMVDTTKANNIVPVLVTEVTIAESKSLKWRIMSWIGKLRGKESYQHYINSNVQKINKWIREYATQNNILVVDLEKLLSNSEGSRKDGYYEADGSHISESAYQAIDRFAQQFLNKELVSKYGMCI
ncbi:MAG: GDSL-type esterase/lipase family protein [Gammaproteobacteria bacterium]|nr:GDSL-type esterase/lipase family protein [Gammaproteobacteria bacterium]